MFRLLDAADVDQWTVQDGLYLRYNAAHGRFEGAPGGSGGGGISATGAVSLAPASSADNIVIAQNGSTTPLTLRLGASPSADGLILQDTNSGSLIRVTSRGDLVASGSLTASGSLLVVRSTALWGSLDVRGPAALENSLAVGGSASLGDLTAGASILGSLTVTGAVSLPNLLITNLLLSTLQVTGSANLGSLAAGASTLSSATVTGNLFVQGDANLAGLTAGAATLNSLTVTGAVSLPNLLLPNAFLAALQVTGSTSLNGLVAGAATLNSAAVTGSLTVQGSTNLNGLIAGPTTLNSLTVTGAVSLPNLLVTRLLLSTLQVTGSTNLNGSLVAGAATLNALTVTGSLLVQSSTNLGGVTAGATTLNSLTVTGTISLPNLLITGATLTGLVVTGSTNLNLLVAGASSLNSLAVTGDTLLKGGLTASGNMTMGGSFQLGVPAPPTTLGDGQFGPNKPSLPPFSVSNRVLPATGIVTNYHPGASGSALPRLFMWDDPLLFWFSGNPVYHSGGIGWTIDKTDATLELPIVLNFAVSGDMKWGFGMDADTVGGGGNADYVPIFDYKSRGGLGADILRGCPADSNPYGCTLFNWAAGGTGSPRSNSYFLTLQSYFSSLGSGLGGLNILTSGGVGLLVTPLNGPAAIFQGTVLTGPLTAAATTVNSLTVTGSTNLLGSLAAGPTTLNSVAVTGSTNLAGLTAGAATLNSVTVTGSLATQGSTNLNGLVAGPTTLNSATVTGSLIAQGNSSLGGLTAGASTLNSLTVTGAVSLPNLLVASAFLASLQVTGATSLNALVGGAATLNALTVTGSLLVQGGTNLGGLTAGVTTLNSLNVTGSATLGSLVVPTLTLNSLVVSGSTNLGGLIAAASTLNSATVTGNLIANGLFTAGASTLNSLTVSGLAILNGGLAVSGSTLLYGSASVTGTITVSPVGARCLTLNHANGFGGATVFMVAASGTHRSLVNFGGLYQWGTDSTFNGATDWWLQNLTTGRLCFQVLASDQINIGAQTGTGPVQIGFLSTSQVGFYGTTPVSQPTAATDLLTGLVNQGLRASGTDVPLYLGGGALVAGATTLNSFTVTGAATLQSALTTSGQVTGVGQLQIWGAASLLNNLTVSGSVGIQKGLSVYAGLTTYGHANYSGSAPTAASGAAAGTAQCPAPVVTAGANDTRGNMTFGSGTAPTSGAVLVVTFNQAYANAPVVDVIPRNTATGSISPLIVSSVSTTGFTVSATHPPVASQGNTVYNVDYMVTG